MQGKSKIRNAVWVLVALAMWVPLSAAQLQIGDNFKMNMNGTVGFGYGGSFSDPGASGHNLNMLGQGLVTGSYYDPKFLNFTVQPYYTRDQNNASSLSIFSDSGITANANLFSGSHFPGFVSYGKNFNRDRTIAHSTLLHDAAAVAKSRSGLSELLGESAKLQLWRETVRVSP